MGQLFTGWSFAVVEPEQAAKRKTRIRILHEFLLPRYIHEVLRILKRPYINFKH